jgi:hypothetical protein
VTVMVCSSATGQDVPPFVIMRGVRQRDAYSRQMPNGLDFGYITSEHSLTILSGTSRKEMFC